MGSLLGERAMGLEVQFLYTGSLRFKSWMCHILTKRASKTNTLQGYFLTSNMADSNLLLGGLLEEFT